MSIEHLHTRINDLTRNYQNLNKFIKTSTEQCHKCNKDYENYMKTISSSNVPDKNDGFQDIPLSSSSSSNK